MTKEIKKEYVSKEDFDGFKSSVVGILENISNKLNEAPERKVMMATENKKEIVGNSGLLPSAEPVIHNLIPEYQVIFDKYFDMDDGFKGMIKGVSFKIEVPLKLSNAQDAHKTFYKNDIRHKILDGHDMEGSIEKYCKLVAQNLNYKRNVKLKL
ncbi:MAG: hypothetical protein WCW65_03115 [Candidatus Paceibacterota bacterium]